MSFSLKELQNKIENLGAAGANGDYCPPSFQYYNSTTLYIPDGVYYQAGPRVNCSYIDLENAQRFWSISNPIYFELGATFSGTTGSGFLIGGQANSNWYSLWLVDTAGSPSPILLPYLSISSFTNPSGSTVVVPSPIPTTISGLLNNYRVVPFSNYLWEITDQKVLPVRDHFCSSAPQIFAGSDNTSTSYSTPVMTSSTAPSPYAVIESSELSTSYTAWYAFRQDGTATGWHSGAGTPQWIGFYFGAQKCINKYRVMARYDGSRWPTGWQFQASNDGSLWTTVDSRSSVSNPGGGTWTSYFTCTVTGGYSYYRLYCTAGDLSYTALDEVHFVEDTRFVATSFTFNGGQSAPFLGRWAPSFTSHSGSSWFFGGMDQVSSYYNDLWRFDFDTEQFFRIATTGGPPTAVHRAAMCYDSVSGTVFVIDGLAAAAVNQVWKCNLGSANTGVWSQLTPGGTSTGARSIEAYAYDQSRRRLWFYGGDASGAQDDLFYYDLAGNGFTRVCDGCTPGARMGASLVYDSVNDVLWLYGGGTGDTGGLSTMYKYTIASNTWTQITVSPQPNTKIWAPAVCNNGYMYMLGGLESSAGKGSDSFWRFNTTTSGWTELPRYNSSTIRGSALGASSSGIYAFHGYDDISANRSVENWKYVIAANEWKRLDQSAELRVGGYMQLAPPATTPSLYLGSIYIQSDGTIREFLKQGWSYTWYNQGTSNIYRIAGTRSTGFGNTSIASVVPPTAYEVKVTPNIGHSGGMYNMRVGLCGNDSGGNLATGFDCPLTSDRTNPKDRETTNLVLTWYQEYSSGWQRYAQTIDYMLSCNQSMRTHFYGHNSVPDYGFLIFAGFTE
jgi:hypothetical protein